MSVAESLAVPAGVGGPGQDPELWVNTDSVHAAEIAVLGGITSDDVSLLFKQRGHVGRGARLQMQDAVLPVSARRRDGCSRCPCHGR